MTESKDVQKLRRAVALLRIVLGIIILATWWENFTKEIYTAQGITDLFTHPDWGIFTHGGGALLGYQSLIRNTILQAPNAFAAFQMVAEFMMGLGLLVGAITPIAGIGATFFFLNLFLAYFGHTEEWIWTYVLLFTAALVVTRTRAGRAYGIDAILTKRRGSPPIPFLW